MDVARPDTTILEKDTGPRSNESAVPATSWPAIFAGAVTAAATTLILIVLGSGVGLSTVSPWPHSGASAATFTRMMAIWLIVVQWLSALLGGYITGRLRTKWVGTHTHEVFFRDTANGFIAWSLATVAGAVLLTSVAGVVSEKGLQVAASAVSRTGAPQALPLGDPVFGYDTDRLLRGPATQKEPVSGDVRAEIVRILTQGLSSGDLSTADREYLGKLVAARAGVTETEAQKRVDDVVSAEKAAEVRAQQAADEARKTAAKTSIYLALSMFIGAFIAAVAAAVGGRLRDLHT